VTSKLLPKNTPEFHLGLHGCKNKKPVLHKFFENIQVPDLAPCPT